MKSVLWIVLLAALTLAIRGHNLRNTFIDGQIYFVDADCYSRMTRAQIVDEHPGTVVRWHEFENYPTGVLPHTTVPLDYLIVGLKWILNGVAYASESFRTSVLAPQMLDVAGALISPLFALLTVVFLSVWARWWVRSDATALRPWMAATPGFLFAVSPILVHGTSLGRPDHQSLVLLLVAIALGLEWVLTERRSPRWAVAAGLVWGMALWVSVYEPLILLVGLMSLQWIEHRIPVKWMRRVPADPDLSATSAPGDTVGSALLKAPPGLRSWWTIGRMKWAALGAVLLVAILIERWHFQLLDESLKEFFGRWASSIAELRHLNLTKPTLYRWLGAACVVSPILLILAARRDRRAISILGMVLLTFALTCWQIRWGYFLALVFAMSLPWQLSVLRWRWLAWPTLLLSLWPTWRDWDEQLFPKLETQKQSGLRRLELQQLRRAAGAMRFEEKMPFIAPWWLSPPLAYWSGQPGVAGSSHESLAGIVDTARFYTTTSPEEAAGILKNRGVAWVLAEDAGRVLATSRAILGGNVPETALAYTLADKPHAVPTFLAEVPPHSELGTGVTGPQFFRLYRVQKEQVQP